MILQLNKMVYIKLDEAQIFSYAHFTFYRVCGNGFCMYSKNKEEHQYLMSLVRKLVYANNDAEQNTEYHQFISNTVVKQYLNFMAHMEGYWKCRKDWEVCFRNSETMRGINANNYAESGIRIINDVVFNRARARLLM